MASILDSIKGFLPDQLQSGINYGDYMNAQSEINRLEKMKQNEAVAAELQAQQEKKMTVGQEYLDTVNRIRSSQGKEPFTGWPEEAMGPNRRVYATDDRMGYPLTPEQEAMYAYASPKRVVQLTPEELADPNMGYPLTPQQEAMYAQASPKRVVQLTPEELAQYNIPNAPASAPQQAQQLTPQEMAKYNLANAPVDANYSGSEREVMPPAVQPTTQAQTTAPQETAQPEQAPMYPERQHEIRRQAVRDKIAKAQQAAFQMAQRNLKDRDLILKTLKDTIDTYVRPEDLKSFDESASAKVIMPQIDNLAKIRDMSKIVYKEVIAAEKEKDPNKKRERLQLMIPKLTQSSGTGGTDAMQIGEFFLGAPELGDYQLWAQTLPGGAANVNNLMTYLVDPKKSGFIARPDDYIEKIKGNYNSIASVRNERMSELEASSSPEWFGRVSGLKPLPLFKSGLESELEGKKPAPQAAPTTTLEKPKRIRFEMKGGALMPIQD